MEDINFIKIYKKNIKLYMTVLQIIYMIMSVLVTDYECNIWET